MSEKYIEQNIDRLDISCKTIDMLKENNIKKISQLVKKSRTNLKELGLDNFEITKIDIELQLLGLGLKGSL